MNRRGRGFRPAGGGGAGWAGKLLHHLDSMCSRVWRHPAAVAARGPMCHAALLSMARRPTRKVCPVFTQHGVATLLPPPPPTSPCCMSVPLDGHMTGAVHLRCSEKPGHHRVRTSGLHSCHLCSAREPAACCLRRCANYVVAPAAAAPACPFHPSSLPSDRRSTALAICDCSGLFPSSTSVPRKFPHA